MVLRVRSHFTISSCRVETQQYLDCIGRSFSIIITELSKARVCGALSMGHCT